MMALPFELSPVLSRFVLSGQGVPAALNLHISS